MKKTNSFYVTAISVSILLSSCGSMNNALKGGLLGGTAGTVVGAGVGALIGKDAKSAAIGAGIGTAIGASTGVIIGKKMDKAAAQAAAIEGARVDSIRDANNLKAVRVTFDSGILFKTGKSTLNTASKDALTKFAKILVENPTMDIAVMGHTDNQGSLEINQKLSQERAQAVASFIETQNVPVAQVKDIIGKNFSEPIGDNQTAGGRAANRRVEIYMYASQKMITDAEAQSK